MSVTFSTPAAALAYVAVECWDDAWRIEAATRAEADQAGSEHAGRCEQCRGHGRPAMFEVHSPAAVNVSNGNAVLLLDLLGLAGPDAWCGRVDGADFLGRVLLAQAIAPADAGRPALETTTGTGARLVDCGRPAGYADDRLTQLRSIAEAAAAAGSTVDWS